MAIFLDTSALAKLYHQELDSEIVHRLVEESKGSCFVSRLGVLEMHSVLAIKERTGAVTAGDAAMVRSRFRADVRRRRFRVVALRPNQYEAAEKLIDCHGVDSGLRALDSLQLACSLDLYRNNLIDFIVTADRILCRVSALENMTSINPEP